MQNGWTDSAIRGATIAAVILAFSYFRRAFPINTAEAAQIEHEPPPSGFWTAGAVALWIVVTVVMTMGLASWWRVLNALWSDSHGPTVVTLYPTGAWWYLYSGFTSLCLSWYAVKPVYRAIMSPRRFTIWDYYQSRKAGFDSNRAFKWLGLIIMVPFTAFFVPSLGCHTRFTEQGLAVQAYGDFSETYHAYDKVRTAGVVLGYIDRSGDFHPDPHIAIRLSNGELWSSRHGFRDPEPVRQEIVELLQRTVAGGVRTVRTEHEL